MGSVKQLCDDMGVLFGLKDGSAYRFFRLCVDAGLVEPLTPPHRETDFQDIAILIVGLAEKGTSDERMAAIGRALDMAPLPCVGNNPFTGLDPVEGAKSFLHAVAILPLAAWVAISQSYEKHFPADVPEDAKELAIDAWMDGKGLHNIVVQTWRNRASIMLTENGKPIWEARFMASTEAAIVNAAQPNGSDLITKVQFGIPTLQAAFRAFEELADEWTPLEKEIA